MEYTLIISFCVVLFAIVQFYLYIFLNHRSIFKVSNVVQHYNEIAVRIGIKQESVRILPDVHAKYYLFNHILIAALCLMSVPASIAHIYAGQTDLKLLRFSLFSVFFYVLTGWTLKRLAFSRMLITAESIYWCYHFGKGNWSAESLANISKVKTNAFRGVYVLIVNFCDGKVLRFFGATNLDDIEAALSKQ